MSSSEYFPTCCTWILSENVPRSMMLIVKCQGKQFEAMYSLTHKSVFIRFRAASPFPT
jgi:hypothetical protein